MGSPELMIEDLSPDKQADLPRITECTTAVITSNFYEVPMYNWMDHHAVCSDESYSQANSLK